MNEIIKALYKSEFPKLKINIGIFKHKKTKEIKFCVMEVSTPLSKFINMYVYDASKWDKLDSKQLEGTERIQECFDNDLLQQIEKSTQNIPPFV